MVTIERKKEIRKQSERASVLIPLLLMAAETPEQKNESELIASLTSLILELTEDVKENNE